MAPLDKHDKTTIKKAYFNLARKYHPDKNPDPDAREKFERVQKAHDILMNDELKVAYDEFIDARVQ